MSNFWKITKIFFVAVAAIGVWQGIESGDFYRVMLNSLIGCYWLVQIQEVEV